MTRLVIAGSFVGQESLGDRALLRCVVARARLAVGSPEELKTIVSAPSVSDMPDRVSTCLDVMSWYGYCRSCGSRLGLRGTLSSVVGGVVATCLRPGWASSALSGVLALRSADALYFYGGTQLAQTWFDINWPSVENMTSAAAASGAVVAFGPQQYGPLDAARKQAFLGQVERIGALVRTRNEECRQSLGLSHDQLLFDEVFSCEPRFPVTTGRALKPEYILVNFRDTNFDDTDRRLRSLDGRWSFLRELAHASGLPLVFFAMSDESFCDDFAWLRDMPVELRRTLKFRTEAYSTDDRRIAELARRALVTVSMSFHGCILSLNAGTPAVPVSDGRYYDHKYSDFSKYVGGQSLPRLTLEGLNAERVSDVLDFVSACDRGLIADARVTADRGMRDWYAEVAGAALVRRSGKRFAERGLA